MTDVAAELGFAKGPERPRRPSVRPRVLDLLDGVGRLCVDCGWEMRTDRERCEHCLVWGDRPPVELDETIEPDVFADCSQCGRQRWTDDTPVCHRCLG
jgi:RNase P subunit RPR2